MAHATIDRPQAVDQLQAKAKRFDNLKFAMWLYLASEVVIFTMLIAVFVVWRVNNAVQVEEIQNSMDVGLVGLNTFLLLGSSWAMVRGLLEIQRGNRKGLIQWFLLMCVLGAVFVALQYVEYSSLAHEGITLYQYSGAEEAFRYEFGMRFYALTAFHGFHVVVGVLLGLLVIRHAQKGDYSPDDYIGVEIFGLYWHFVDVVWIFLFTLIYLI
jgi:cytochrome c oxidase subunit III